MKLSKFFTLEKILLTVIVALTIVGFWYFEPSLFLRWVVVLVIIFGLLGAFFSKKEISVPMSRREPLVLFSLYLGIYVFYNLLYGLAIPLYIVMLLILIFAWALIFILLSLDQINELVKKEIFQFYIVLMGLAVLEIFLALSFWPIDPKIKSLIIVLVFYLINSFVYLYVHNVLKLKRIIGYLVVSMLILGILIANMFFSLNRG